MPSENDNKLVNLLDLKEAYDNSKHIQTAVSSPSASGTAVAFIDSISQNTNGVISPTKKTVAGATQSAAGLMSAADKTKLDGITAGAAVTSINNQTGAVSVTPESIGAVAKSGDTMTGTLTVGASNSTVQMHNSVNSAGGELFLYSDGSAGNIGVRGLYSIRNGVHRQPVKIDANDNVTFIGTLYGNATNVSGIVDITNGGTNASTSDGARENIGIYSAGLGEASVIINNNPTLTTMDALTQYIFDTYLLPKNKPLECVTLWSVTNPYDDRGRCIGANADLGTIYNNLTGVRPSYGALTFERIPHERRIIVTYTPLRSGTAAESKCPQIYAMYGANDNSWATGTQLSNTSGWYIKAATRVKGNAESSYRWGDVNLTPANIGAPETITMFHGTYSEWSTIYNRFVSIPEYSVHNIYLDSAVVQIVTANANTPIDVSLFGTIVRTTVNDINSVCIFARSFSVSDVFSISLVGMTASSQGTTNIYKISGTLQ